jgi:hypothetical protein
MGRKVAIIMAKKVSMADIMEALNNINARLDALENRPTTSKEVKGKGSATSKKFSTDLKDYEPKKDANGNYIWQSYKNNRTKFCYAVATKGNSISSYKDGEKVYEDFSDNSPYYKAKAQFEKKYKYIKKADR